jgi:hypothetical protein
MRSRPFWRSILLGVALLVPLAGANRALSADACADPHDTLETACLVGDGGGQLQLIRASITSSGGRNFYAIQAAQPGTKISVWLEDLPVDYDLDLLAENGGNVNQSAAEELAPEFLEQPELAAGWYYAMVKSYPGVGFDPNAQYSLYIQVFTPEPPAPPPTAIVPTAIPVATVTPTPSAQTFTIFFSIDGSGNPSGYVRDPSGGVKNLAIGQTTEVVVRFGQRLVFETPSDSFSMLFDCGPSDPAVQPCNFNASNRGQLPAEIVVRNRNSGGGFIGISGPNRYGGDRPGFSGQKYVNDPKVTIFVNPNPK